MNGWCTDQFHQLATKKKLYQLAYYSTEKLECWFCLISCIKIKDGKTILNQIVFPVRTGSCKVQFQTMQKPGHFHNSWQKSFHPLLLASDKTFSRKAFACSLAPLLVLVACNFSTGGIDSYLYQRDSWPVPSSGPELWTLIKITRKLPPLAMQSLQHL